jgi:cytochrome c oxidase subunit II
MPDGVRRKLLLVLVVAVAALAGASVAAASDGGFAPPSPASPNAENTRTAYLVILAFTGVIFLVVETLLIVFIVKYRRRGRPRTADGAQVHGNTRLEVIWTVIPVLILLAIGLVVFFELPKIENAPASANPLHITVEGHQYYWQFNYPNGARSINDLHVPQGEVVDLDIVSADVIHSWWIPELGGKIQAIPGRTNKLWFEATRTGVFGGQCAELCGIFHAAMKAQVFSETDDEFNHFIQVTAKTDLGRGEFQGVCATCHGMQGQGGYGPAIANNPILTQKAALENLVRDGRGNMPPVGDTWNQAQMNALYDYVSKHVYKGAASGG